MNDNIGFWNKLFIIPWLKQSTIMLSILIILNI